MRMRNNLQQKISSGRVLSCTAMLDEPTKKFIRSLKFLIWEKTGMSVSQFAKSLNISSSLMYQYISFKKIPSIRRLMFLVNYFDYDLSESINYKLYHKKIVLWDLKARMRNIGMTFREASQILNCKYRSLNRIFWPRDKDLFSVCILADFISMLEREEAAYKATRKVMNRYMGEWNEQ